MQSGKTCGPGYEKLTSVDECPSPPDTRLDTETLAGPNYSGWIVLHRGNDVYYVYFVCEDALMPHSYTTADSVMNGCVVFDDTRNINRRSRYTITEEMVTRVRGERENKRGVDGSHYLSLLKQNPDQNRDREIPKIFAKYLEQYEYARKKNQECRPIVRIDPFMRKKGSSTDETAWHDFFSKHGLPSQEKKSSTCIGHTGDSELIGHATGRCFWIKLNGLWGDKISFDDAESTEVRAVAIGLPPDADTSTPEKLKQLKKTQIENLDKVTVAVIEQIRKEHPDGVGGREKSQGSWAVCDERRWLDCESGNRIMIGGMICFRAGMSRSCWFWTIPESSFMRNQKKDLKVSELNLDRKESTIRPWLYFFDRFVSSSVYDPERGEVDESNFAIPEICDRAPRGMEA